MSDRKKDRYIIPFDDIPADRVKMPCIEIDEAVCSFTEVETGLPRELARQEAMRCLSCRRCLGCALCWGSGSLVGDARHDFSQSISLVRAQHCCCPGQLFNLCR